MKIYTTVVCLAFLGYVGAGDKFECRGKDGCPNKWHAFGGQCYFLSEDTAIWCQARFNCRMREGKLAELKDETQINFITGLIKQKYKKHWNSGYWIGLSDQLKENFFIWESNGKCLGNFNSWRNGEPNNYKGFENCVEMKHGKWNDDDCTKHKLFICQKDN